MNESKITQKYSNLFRVLVDCSLSSWSFFSSLDDQRLARSFLLVRVGMTAAAKANCAQVGDKHEQKPEAEPRTKSLSELEL